MSSPIRKIGIIFKKQDPRIQRIADDIVPWLQSRGVEVFLDQALEDQCRIRARFAAPEEFIREVEIAGVFGGDGTLLYAARLSGQPAFPYSALTSARSAS
jgi:NAD kinase